MAVKLTLTQLAILSSSSSSCNKMAGIVRSSKYRHVFGESPKTDKCYTSVKINKGPWEGNMSAVNSKFLAVSMEQGGGGAFIVICLDKVSRLCMQSSKINMI